MRTASLDLGTTSTLNAGIPGELLASTLSLSKPKVATISDDLAKDSELGIVVKDTVELDENGKVILTQSEESALKSYLKKVDIRIVPIFMVLYLLAVLDRANIGSAKVAGMEQDLGLTPTDFGNITSFFFIGYILFQIPSNMMLKLVSPARWIPTIVVGWSCLCMGMAFVHSSAALVTLRFFLGAFEAGFTPGVVFMMSFFYLRSQQGLRNSLFFSAGTLSGVISGPIALGLKSIHIPGLESWQTIFLLEGALSCFFGLMAYFILPSYPETSKFLNTEEREVAMKLIKHDQGLAAEAKISGRQALNAFMDWKLWVYGVMFFCVNLGTVALAIFSPTLIQGMGFSGDAALYLSALPSFTGLIGQLSTGWLMGRVSYSVLVAGFSTITVASVLATMFIPSSIGKLVFLALAGLGAFPCIPLIATWTSLSMGGVTKRGIASGFVVMAGGIAGIVTSYLFPSTSAPTYYLGMGMFAGCFALMIVFAIVLRFYYTFENKRRDENPLDITHLTNEEVENLCDKNPTFRYVL